MCSIETKRKGVMRIILAAVWLVAFNMTASGREVKLEIWPAKMSESAKEYRLLPIADVEADAVPLYEQAIKALQDNTNMEQIQQWRNMPIGQLPHEQIEQVLQQYKQAMELVKQATRCKNCDWPYLDPDTAAAGLGGYRKLAFLLALQVRFHIAKGQYDKAIGAMQTGFATAKQLSKAHTLVEGLVGIAVAAVMCRELEQFIQGPEAPNLYWALQDLPKPYIDLAKHMEYEDTDIKEKVRLLMNRLDRHLAALQCVEAICLYAGTHDCKLPNDLGNITNLSVPNDPVRDKPFEYELQGTKVILAAPIPEGGSERDVLRYVIVLRK